MLKEMPLTEQMQKLQKLKKNHEICDKIVERRQFVQLNVVGF